MTTATAPTAAPPQAKTAVKLVFRLEGHLPRTDGRVVLETNPTPLTRDHLRAAREQLTEALETALRFRLAKPVLKLLSEDGRTLRETTLMEAPDRSHYLATERAPGRPAGATDEWLVHCVADFGRRRVV